jgi:hypothetical protein
VRVGNTLSSGLAGFDSLKNAVLTPSAPMAEPEIVAKESAAATRGVTTRNWLLPIASLVAIYVALATAYNMSVPLYEAPDEQSHVEYVDSLYRTGRIPEIAQTYEAIGPPLYHAAGAAVLKLFGFSPPHIPLERNADQSVRANLFLHNPGENDLPYRGPVLSIHVLRGISTIFGLGTIVLVYFIALLLFPERRLLAWAAGANTAVLPQFAFVGASVMNDTAVAFFGAAAVYASLRVVKGGATSWVLVAAGSLALGFLTEASMIVAATVSFLALLFAPLSWRGRLLAIGALVAVPLAIAGWFYVERLVEFGHVYPGDQIADGPAFPITSPVYRDVVVFAFQQSYWFTGGWMNVRVSGAIYALFDVVSGMALGGMIVIVMGRGLTVFQRRGLVLLTALFTMAVIEVLWVSSTISLAAQGRFLFIAQPAIALFLAAGTGALFQRDVRRDHAAIVVLPVVLLALNIGILTLTLPAAY